MKNTKQSIILVHFEEYPFYVPVKKKPSVHDIILTDSASITDYCQALFRKILDVGLSELPAFLQYHCKLVKDPHAWLNSLEKLIKVNSKYFNNEDLRHRRSKLISQFDIQRFRLESSNMVSKRESDLHNTVKSFSDEKEFDFRKTLTSSKEFESDEERIVYLQNQIYEYRQNYIHKAKTYDELCQLEIDRLKINIDFLQKLKLDQSNDPVTAPLKEKIRIKTKLNFFVDIFYQMLREWKIDGEYIIKATNTQVAQLISNNFLDKSGKAITVRAVQTILEINRPEKRPKSGKRFNPDSF
jgi:hypothetical protein